MRRFLGAILSTVFGFLGLFCDLFQHFCQAGARSLGIAPTVPPADDDGELEEIAREDAALRGAEDLNLVRNWASAKLYGLEFPLPASAVGRWLSSLGDQDMSVLISVTPPRQENATISPPELVLQLKREIIFQLA
ncbi:MAG: hypothetical protein JWR80_6523 [Bradyrhizobium sp.]|nr:hypothetical protein [Bradyrhizobium sp.]